MDEKLKWQNCRYNKQFLIDLYKAVGEMPFNLPRAYIVFWYRLRQDRKDYWMRVRKHQETESDYEVDLRPVSNAYWYAFSRRTYWSKVNVRNTISMAAYNGLLKRVDRGVYRFTWEGYEKIQEWSK